MTPTINLNGLFFNQRNIDSELEVYQSLKISKDTLDHSSGYIMGQFAFDNVDSRTALVWTVFVDGIKTDTYGSNLPDSLTTGVHNITLFKYPNSARANKLTTHKIHVSYGYITGIVENASVDWSSAQNIKEVDYTITLE